MDILTHSAMSQFKNCRKKYQFRYEMGLVPKRRKASLDLGSAVHKGLEIYYQGETITEAIQEAVETLSDIDRNGWTQEDFDKESVQKALVEAMLGGYANYFNDREQFEEIKPEVDFAISLINPETNSPSRTFIHGGKSDGLFKRNGQWWLREFKTASQVGQNYLDRLKLDTQITSYVEALEHDLGINIVGIIYTILKKPSIRQKKDETVEQFCERLKEDYLARPDFYFYQEELFRTKDDLLEFKFEKWEIAKDIIEARKANRFYRNTSMCSLYGECEYMALCTRGNAAMGFYTQKDPHEELSENIKKKAHG